MRIEKLFISFSGGIACGVLIQIILASLIAIITAPVWIVFTPIGGAFIIGVVSIFIWKARREFVKGAYLSLAPLAILFGIGYLLFATGLVMV